MKSLLAICFITFLASFSFAQDFAAAQTRADDRMEVLTPFLSLTATQLPLVQGIFETTEKAIETINANASLSETQKAEQVTAKRTEETTKLKGVLTADQYSKYTSDSNPAPAKSGINTSRSSIKSK